MSILKQYRVNQGVIHRKLSKQLALINPLLEEKDRWRHGGWYACLQVQSQALLIKDHCAIGIDPLYKSLKYSALVLEKAARLSLHLEHNTSRQSRNEKTGQWGGAIRAGNLIFAFSGLPEKWDEALMLWLAVKLGLMNEENAQVIGSTKVNACLKQLLVLTA